MNPSRWEWGIIEEQEQEVIAIALMLKKCQPFSNNLNFNGTDGLSLLLTGKSLVKLCSPAHHSTHIWMVRSECDKIKYSQSSSKCFFKLLTHCKKMFGGCMWAVFQMNMWNISRRHVKHSIWCVGFLYNMNRIIMEPFLASAALKDISSALMHLYKQSPTSISLFFSSLHCICLHLLQASQPSTDWQTNWNSWKPRAG